jgi:hypothetical protein
MFWSIEEPEKIRIPRGRLNIGCYLLLVLQLWCVCRLCWCETDKVGAKCGQILFKMHMLG